MKAKLLLGVLSITGSWASLIALFIPNVKQYMSEQYCIAFSIVSLLGAIGSIAWFFNTWSRQSSIAKKREFATQAEIDSFMSKWIGKDGRVAIFSHDLTWVSSNPAIRQLLIRKSKKHEVTLCLPRLNEIGKELEAAGAEVATYPELDLVPESRFTIVHYGKQGAEVAIGRRVGGKHRIDEYTDGRHPAFSLANDMIEIVLKLHAHLKNVRKDKR